MLNTEFRPFWLIAAWFAAVAVTGTASIAIGANASTTALLLAVGIAPGMVIALLAHGEASPSVAQILYSVEKDGRS